MVEPTASEASDGHCASALNFYSHILKKEVSQRNVLLTLPSKRAMGGVRQHPIATTHLLASRGSAKWARKTPVMIDSKYRKIPMGTKLSTLKITGTAALAKIK